MAKVRKEKSLTEKIGDAVESLIHGDKAELDQEVETVEHDSELDQVAQETKVQKQGPEFQDHPKFDKFGGLN